jgi:Flp pilus assembly protein TadG
VRGEEGQVLVLFAAGLLVVLLAAAGVVVDFGHAYVVKRHLQSSADAAAIAGADALPSVANALSAAAAYGTGGKNPVGGASEETSAYCLASVSYCYGSAPGSAVGTSGQANGLVVKESASVPTTFLKLFGVSSVTVGAKATACGLCGAVPLNIAVVADRTGSMSSSIGDLRDGLRTFLETLNPTLDWVSLLVLPPAPWGTDCWPAADGAFPYDGSSYPSAGDSDYVVAHFSHDYLVRGQLNASSTIVQQISCMRPSGGTAYKQALQAAYAELENVPANRAAYPKVIVFETDGAANMAPESWYDRSSGREQRVDGQQRTMYRAASGHSDDILRPCGSAVDYARSLQAQGVTVMTVGYRTRDQGCWQAPHYSGVGYQDVPESIDAAAALAQMASPGGAYSADGTSGMQAPFATIAGKLVGAKLVPDSEAGS